MIKLVGLSLLLNLSLIFEHSDCPCRKFPFDVDPPWGHMVIAAFEDKPIAQMRGKVLNPLNEPVSNAWIYVWHKPASVSDEQFSITNLQDDDKLLACTTSEDGEFCFEDVLPGGY